MKKARQQDKVIDLGLVAPTSAPESDTKKELDLFTQLTAGTEDDEEAVELTDDALGSLGEEYRVVAELTRKKRSLEAHVKAVSAALESARGRMQNAMILQGTKQFKGTEDDGACSVGSRYRTKVDDPQAFISWVMSTAPELLTVNAATRTKYVRENYKDKGVPTDADEFPPGIHAEEEAFLQVRGVREVTPKAEATNN